MKKTFLNDIGLAILRIGASALLLTHGIPKFQQLLNGNFEFGNPLGIGEAPSLFLAVIGEFVCPILIILGYKTKWVAIPPAIVMVVAALIVHSEDSFAVKEHALLFLIMFIAILLLGPGKYSFDRK